MAARKLRGTDIKCIRSYMVDFFRIDTEHEGHCVIKDFVVDEELDEAYADIKTKNGWYSACLRFEQRFGRNIIPTDFSFSKY
ncbi:hypothetical protein [Clostridium cylindrosporum]|uniref:Uncharacterized protein n=1 Tax=Clostridium cylindrosporum DSM 605 TaxID=1121307 RepID=A0A0J8DFF1_CLOCY|nr:hypothetical protein [Clostridium cylindrosporum]KMT22979.1 hypothetical protein CLCY_7c00260 [Clostridium cylindrosporum DSM 605]